jgi:2-C-methyl-D-erythritol 4-phosphate cytidylyltransferase
VTSRELISQPVVLIWVADPNAFHPLAKSSVLSVAANRAATANCNPKVIIAIDLKLKSQYEALDQKLKPNYPTEFIENLTAAKALIDPTTQVLFVHDACRPLTSIKTFQVALDALLAGAAAARPAHVVVDTLKQISADRLVTATIDRNTVQALTSPECYWVESIADVPATDGWSFKLKPGETQELIHGDLESIRVRSAADVVLVESFLEWERLNHSSS